MEALVRIAWGITGAGHFLRGCIGLITELKDLDLFLSKAGEEVLGMYQLRDITTKVKGSVIRDNVASAPTIGGFANSRYGALIVAPATSNSVAKFTRGISDSLITNLFAQAGKNRIPIAVLPTDVAPEINSSTQRGRPIKVYPRPIDLENTAKLREFPGVKVVKSVEEIREWLTTFS